MVDSEERAQAISRARAQNAEWHRRAALGRMVAEQQEAAAEGEQRTLPVIIKADVQVGLLKSLRCTRVTQPRCSAAHRLTALHVHWVECGSCHRPAGVALTLHWPLPVPCYRALPRRFAMPWPTCALSKCGCRCAPQQWWGAVWMKGCQAGQQSWAAQGHS